MVGHAPLIAQRVRICRRGVVPVVILAVALMAYCPIAGAQPQSWKPVRVVVEPTLDLLMADEDTDGDTRITIDDPHVAGTARGDRRFSLRDTGGSPFEIAGTYYLSNLLVVLKVAQDSGRDSINLAYEDLFDPPVRHISRSIRERYWKGLTRTIDEIGLKQILADEKSETLDGRSYIYVPPGDTLAGKYFKGLSLKHPDWELTVVTLPDTITAGYVRSLDGRHGILSLGLRKDSTGALVGVPFVVPGGRFNELYGWDSYFIVLGLLQDGYVAFARSMVDNLVYEVRHYGKILNANRTYYLTRSQPPFLTSMAIAVYERLPRGNVRKRWLRGVLEAAIREYHEVWMGPARLTAIGLSRYSDTGFGLPPEVEPGRFDSVFARAARGYGLPFSTFRNEYQKGRIHVPELNAFFRHDRAMRESGHDASYRLLERCADIVTVDLNSLLFKTETDIALILDGEFNGSLTLNGTVERSSHWRARAHKRKSLMNEFLWNASRGMFFDYDVVNGTQTEFESATTFYPLWAGLATGEQAAAVVANAIPLLAMSGGVAGSTEQSRGPVSASRPQSQWDYPFGWAPHQILVWSGLQRYQYDNLAADLAYRWLYTIALNACNYSGTMAEKYDVTIRSAQVFAEYGNVGTKFSYITREGFGWTNASFVIGQAMLTPRQRDDLNRLIAPEWLGRSWGNSRRGSARRQASE